MHYSAFDIAEHLLILNFELPGAKLVIDSEGARYTWLADAFGDEDEANSLTRPKLSRRRDSKGQPWRAA